MMVPHGVRAAACALALAAMAPAQTQLYEYANLGWWVTDAGDIDGDGRGDFLISNPFLVVGGIHNTGIVRAFSGRTGAALYTINAFSPGSEIGWAMSKLGDVSGDSRADFLVGARFASPEGLFQAGEVYVFDGATGAVLHTFTGTYFDGRFGHAIHGGGELDGDGVPDILVGDTTASPNFMNGAGQLFGYSGADFSELFLIPGEAAGDWFANDVAFVGDLDGDALDEFIAGAPLHEVSGPTSTQSGRAYLYSGAGPTLLQTFDGAGPLEYLGYTVGPGGDVSGDGTPDFLIGMPFSDVGGQADVGRVRVLSGLDYSLVYEFVGEALNDQFGYGLDGGGDVDGDGRADVVVGALNYDVGTIPNAGRGYVFSGRTGLPIVVSDGNVPGGQFARRVAMLGRVNCGLARDFAFGGARTRILSEFDDCLGAGCPGTPGDPASIGKTGGEPVLGSAAFALTVNPTLPFAPAILFLGLSSVQYGGQPLPLDLSGLGLPGCYLRISPDIGTMRFADAWGLVVAEVPVPDDPALDGLELAAQWLLFDSGAANGQFTLSDAARLVVRTP